MDPEAELATSVEIAEQQVNSPDMAA